MTRASAWDSHLFVISTPELLYSVGKFNRVLELHREVATRNEEEGIGGQDCGLVSERCSSVVRLGDGAVAWILGSARVLPWRFTDERAHTYG